MDKLMSPEQALKYVWDNVSVDILSKKDQKLFKQRLTDHFPALYNKLLSLYGEQKEFTDFITTLVSSLVHGFKGRSLKLKAKDLTRLANPTWYRDNDQVGMAVYVDLFAGDLKGLIQKIPYLKTLGITYLHLMPLYLAPEGDSDGGYAVSDYRTVDPKLGNKQDLIKLAKALAEEDISLVLDFVFNHTSDEHEWAMKAKQGDALFADYYYLFDDKQEVDEYNQTLREIFPTVRRGSFTHIDEINKWVWTTFNSFQWDLKYSNPMVFNAITEEMLFLANTGCEGLRLDALAFIWKEKGTRCESLPKAHTLIQAFNLCLQICAPAVVFKSEAIVHPDEVAQYIGSNECQLSYNPLMMALLWESLATRKTELLTASLKRSFQISNDTTWVNYIRCHDDIGWTFDDDVADRLGINGYDHRKFLNNFYTGRFDGSFATGVPFQENPTTGDCRVCGSLSSLTGVEQALNNNSKEQLNLALGRIRLLNSVIFGIGGIPLIYQGDELGILNDNSYLEDASKKDDSRWVNRPHVSKQAIKDAETGNGWQREVNESIKQIINLRKDYPLLGQGNTEIFDTYHQHLFAYYRYNGKDEKLLAVCNFSESSQSMPFSITDCLGEGQLNDLLSGNKIDRKEHLTLAPYQVVWLVVK